MRIMASGNIARVVAARSGSAKSETVELASGSWALSASG